MDLKHKGRTWVGNMFQKFEAACQEVDNIINQDTVNYVGNQVSSAGENVKKLYSDVVQGLLPPIVGPRKYEAKAAAQRKCVRSNVYFKSPSDDEGKSANNVVNKSSVGHGTSDQINNQSKTASKVTFENEEVAEVPTHSFLESNAHLPMEKIDDFLLDKDLNKNMKENDINELSETSDGKLMDKLLLDFMDTSGPLSHSLRNGSSEINDTNEKSSLIYEDSGIKLEDDVLFIWNNDGILTNKDASQSAEEDTSMEFNASDPLKPMANHTSCPVKVASGEVAVVLDNSHLPLESSRLSRNNDEDLSDEGSDEFFDGNSDEEKSMDKSAFMDTSDPLSQSLRNGSSESNDTDQKFSSVYEDSDLELEDDVLLIGNSDAVLTDKDTSKSAEENITMEFNASDPLKPMAYHTSCPVKVANGEATVILDNSHLSLESSRLSRNNGENLSDEGSDEFFDGNSGEGKLMDMLAFTDASDPLSHSPRNESSGINDTNKKSSSVYENSDLELEDDVFLVGKNDRVLTDKDASKSAEEDTTMEFNASDPLKPLPNHTSCPVKIAYGEANVILDNSHLPLESSRLSRNNDEDLSDEDSDEFSEGSSDEFSEGSSDESSNGNSDESSEFSKNVVIMESTDHLNNNHLSHGWSGTNFKSKEADNSNLLLKSEVLSGRTDHVLIDKDFKESPIKDGIFEDDPNSYLLNLPSDGSGVSFSCEEVFMVSDRNYLQLKPELRARKNGDALPDKYSNETLKKNTILELEHDASYPLKIPPRCTSSSIKFEKEEVSSVSNNSFTKLESEVFCGKNSEGLADKASDASCKEQGNLELSTELTLHCDKGSIKETLCSRGNECEEDIVTSNENPQETSIHSTDVESNRKVGQTSSILVNNLLDFSLRMETTSNSKYLENGTGYSSNASDATSSELASVVLTSGETVKETKPFSFLKPLPEGSISASRSSVNNFSSSTVVQEKPADQRASIECDSRPSFEVVPSSFENKALEMRSVSFGSSLSSMESPGTHVSRASETASLPQFRTSSQVDFSKSTNPGALSFSSGRGCTYNSCGYIQDAEMETVDLGQKVTLEDECDIVDYKALHAVSRRTQKLRSYKKRIQDAFTSKKKLAKEYEQLAIWYGDTDLNFNTESSQKLDTKNASTNHASDSEWELV